MKIGIDTFGCGHGQSGIGSYLNSLLRNFRNTEEIQFELFGAEIDRYVFGRDSNLGFEPVFLPDNRHSEKIWSMFFCNHFARSRKYDAMLFPSASSLPFFSATPSVAVVNDIVSGIFEENDFAGRLRIRRGLREVSKVIVPNNFVRKDLERLGIDKKKIIVVHNGVNHSLFYPRTFFSSESEMIRPFAIRRPYFLYATKISSHLKRHVELIKAFEIFKKRSGLPHRLVLAGGEGACSDIVRKTASLSPYAPDIFITGYLPHESLPAFYARSDACIFPSEIEGTGLPVLEAMATGIPVACSKAGALQEMTGGKAIIFDSSNIEEISFAIEKLASDAGLRKKMTEEGIVWARRFDWESTARETIKVLRSVVK